MNPNKCSRGDIRFSVCLTSPVAYTIYTRILIQLLCPYFLLLFFFFITGGWNINPMAQ